MLRFEISGILRFKISGILSINMFYVSFLKASLITCAGWRHIDMPKYIEH
jgi:hypothetical protein